MTSLEASLKLRDKFTSVLRTIDDGLKKTTKSMENLKDKATGPAQALNKMTAAARQAVDKLNSSIKSGMDKAASVVQTSTARILTLFGSFGNGISKTLKLDVVSNKFSSFFGNIKKSFDNLTGKTKKNNAIADIEKQLDRLQKKETKIQLNIDKLPTVQKKIESLNNRLDRLSNAKADIVANVKNADVAEKRLEKLDKHAERLNNRKTVLQVEVDKIDRAKAHLDSVKKEIDELNAKKIELNTTRFTSSVNRIKSSISTAVDAFNSLKSKATSGFNGVVSAVKNGVSKIGGFLKQSGNTFKQYGNDMKNAFDKMKSSASSAGGGFKSMVAAIGVTKALSAAVNTVKSSVGSAIDRFDTLNQFPKVMQSIGFSANDAAKSKDALIKGIDGLPTTLGDVVSNTQRIATLTRDLDGATKTTISLNNAFLSSGSSADDASRGLDQYVQMLSRGEVDLQSWRSLQETMGSALYDLSDAFGFAGKSAQNDLYDALKDGTITFDQFNKKLIELYDTGTDGAKRALIGSEGIKTSFKNIRTAVTNGVEGSIRKIDTLVEKVSGKNIAKHLDGFKQKVKDAFSFINGNEETSGLLDKLPGLIEKATPYVDVLKNSFESLKQPISDAVDAVKKSLGELTGDFGSEKSVAGFQGFVDSIANGIKKLAGFVEKHSDSIAKLIEIMPKLALAFVGFKIGKGVLTPLLNFGSGLFGITKATGKLAGGLGKAFGGLFKKMPKDGLEVPGTGKKGAASALNPVGGLLDTLNNFAKGASGIALAFGVIKLIEEAAQALKDINDKVPSDLSSLAPKLLNMSIAVGGMTAFVKSMGKFASLNTKSAIGGMLTVAGISANLMLAAEAMKQINDKVPSNIGGMALKIASMTIAIVAMGALVAIAGWASTLNGAAAVSGLLIIAGISADLMIAAEAMKQVNDKVPSNIADFAPKIANIAIAIGGMAALAGALGAITASGIGALVLAGGLATVAVIAGELMLVSEAIQQMDQKVPSDLSGVKSKIDTIAQVIQHFTDANLGSVLDLFGNIVGTINTAVVITGINKFTELADSLSLLSDAEVNAAKVKNNINKIKDVISELSDGGGLFGKLKDAFSNSIDNGLISTAKDSISDLVEIGADLNELQLTTFNASVVKKKISDINSVISDLGSSGIGSIITSMVKTAELNTVKETLTSFLDLFEPINEMSNTALLTGSAKSKIGFIEELITTLGDGSISGVIGTMLKKAEVTEVKDTLVALFDLYEPINQLSNNAVATGSAKSKIGFINDLISVLGTASLGKVVETMLKTAEVNSVKNTLDSVFNLFEPINSLSNTALFTGSAKSKVILIGDLVATIGTGSLGAILETMLKAEELDKVKLTLDAVFALYEPINLLSNTAVATGSAKSKIELIRQLLATMSQASLGVTLTELVTIDSVNNANNALDGIVRLGNAINAIAGIEIDITRAVDTINNIKMIIRQLSNFPEVVGLEGMQAIVDTFNQLTTSLSEFITTTTISISGLEAVSTAFNTNMVTIDTSVSETMTSITAKAADGMTNFNAALQTGINVSVSISQAGKTSIIAAFGGMQADLYNAGQMAMSGLTNGINAGAGSAISAAQRVAEQVASTVRRALDIHSPSRIMDSIGRFIPAGLARGIERATHLVRSASESLALATIPTDLANVSASGNITSNVMLDDSEIARLKASTKQEIVVNQKQVTPQVTIYVDNKNGEPIDEEALLEKFEAKIIELYDSDLN